MAENLFMDNIDALCKMQGRKKGELERKLGKSRGFLSRKSVNDLTWNQINEIALFFGKKVEDMMCWNFTKEAEIEELLKRQNELGTEMEEISKKLSELGAM